MLVFYAVRAFLAVVSATTDTALVAATKRFFGNTVANFLCLFLLFSPGMFISTTSTLQYRPINNMVSVLELRIYNRFLAEFVCNDVAVNVVDFLDKKTMDFSGHVRRVRSDHWVAILSPSWRKYRTITPSR
jgi:hypothetical protein